MFLPRILRGLLYLTIQRFLSQLRAALITTSAPLENTNNLNNQQNNQSKTKVCKYQ